MTSDRVPRQVPIAVVGMAAFMPGSTDLGGFWRNVLTGRDLMTDVPASRWLIEDYYDPDPRATDKTYGRRGAFLPEVDFDPVHYGIPPNSLPAIDTSQLLALMVAERVIADCAVGLPEDRERVSVLLGVAPLQLLVESAARLDRPVWLKALRERPGRGADPVDLRQHRRRVHALVGGDLPGPAQQRGVRPDREQVRSPRRQSHD
jgi:acyl transferase domain-containing protein